MHWHAFGYSGTSVPDDSAAKDPAQAVRPIELHGWFAKPRSMHKGAFSDADSAYAWLESELKETYGDVDRLPWLLAHHRNNLGLMQDAYAGFYARGGFHVRCLLTCPRTGADLREVRCPGPPQ